MPFSQSHKRNFERMGPWLAQPIAHRGLHNDHVGVLENTLSAFQRAMEKGYGVETDLQESADGVPMVFHDATLDRLTEGMGRVSAFSATELKRIRYRTSADDVWSLDNLLDFVAGRAPLLLEIKRESADGAERFAARIANSLKSYVGPAAVMSFEPGIVAAFRAFSPQTPRGLVAMRFKRNEWPYLSALERFRRTHLLSYNVVRPDFIAYNWLDLPAAGPTFARNILKLPMFVWTVSDPDVLNRTVQDADNIIFEGFNPDGWRRNASRSAEFAT